MLILVFLLTSFLLIIYFFFLIFTKTKTIKTTETLPPQPAIPDLPLKQETLPEELTAIKEKIPKKKKPEKKPEIPPAPGPAETEQEPGKLEFCLGQADEEPSGWTNKPMSLSFRKFEENTDKLLFIKFDSSKELRNISAGFSYDGRKLLKNNKNGNIIFAVLKDFSDSDEIRIPLENPVFYAYFEFNKKIYTIPAINVHVTYKCRKCSFSADTEEKFMNHAATHTEDIIEHLSYEELRKRSNNKLPIKIYQCSYCNYYILDDGSDSKTTAIETHQEKECRNVAESTYKKDIKFRVVRDVDEIRKKIIKDLPVIYRCSLCAKEFTGNEIPSRNSHLKARHSGELFELL